MKIGQRIKEVIREKGVTVTWVAKQIPCERTNLYNIFSRKDVSAGMLMRLSLILDHDFFKELSNKFNRDRVSGPSVAE